MAALTPAPLEGSLIGGRRAINRRPPCLWARGGAVNGRPRPLARSGPGAADQSACVFSDNSVVGHTRINRVVHHDPGRQELFWPLGVHGAATWIFTHTRVTESQRPLAGGCARVSGTLQTNSFTARPMGDRRGPRFGTNPYGSNRSVRDRPSRRATPGLADPDPSEPARGHRAFPKPRRSDRRGQAPKGAGGMPRRHQDSGVEGCEKSGGAAQRASIPEFPRRPRELKHLSTWRKRNQPRLPQ